LLGRAEQSLDSGIERPTDTCFQRGAVERPRPILIWQVVEGPFYPGIEASRVMLVETTYDKQRPFRIKVTLAPGTLTAGMAVPWQADFNDCNSKDGADWWLGQRPNEVRRSQNPDGPLAKWAPDNWEYIDMVKNWSKLGFVVETTVANKIDFVEDERSADLA
jgi:hypothetical protein